MKIENNFKTKMLNWANQFNIFCLLDNNNYTFETPEFECLLALGCCRSYTFTGKNDASNLNKYYKDNPTWLFGHFGYNAFGNAYKNVNDANGFGKGFFFEPDIILKVSGNSLVVLKSNIDEQIIFEAIDNTTCDTKTYHAVVTNSVISKAKYLQDIAALQQHIKRGDCYEINYCQKFEATQAAINPIETYLKLATHSPAPFAALYKLNDNYCICASPERFLKKSESVLTSQPIKGTSRRSNDIQVDDANKAYLRNSEKERSENVMVVDLVRNDLSIISTKGSVQVKELYGIYSFPQVHQMISTIQSTISDDVSMLLAIEECYPMGSMTGAPKQKVMQLIELYEATPRGLFSGSLGYFTPEQNFDFNVVIRSVFYNQAQQTVSIFAGSGITFYADAEKEYDECMAKAEAMMKVLC
jgi:para-aminobenzoate synthetase component I